MKKLTGYFIVGIGSLGFLFFLNYRGTVIPLREMWFVLSIILAGVGGFWVIMLKWEKMRG